MKTIYQEILDLIEKAKDIKLPENMFAQMTDEQEDLYFEN